MSKTVIKRGKLTFTVGQVRRILADLPDDAPAAVVLARLLKAARILKSIK